jgi:hypothetical protein
MFCRLVFFGALREERGHSLAILWAAAGVGVKVPGSSARTVLRLLDVGRLLGEAP